MLLALILLGSLTACKTVYVVPTIQEPPVAIEPEHEEWEFIAVDNKSFLISEKDLKILTQYIIDLRAWGRDRSEWVQYYIDELERVEEMFK